MKKKPIIFNSDMVRAIVDGRKTQTRRLIKCRDHPFFFNDNVPDFQKEQSIDLAPYKVGDVLYVRETCAKTGIHKTPWTYRADWTPEEDGCERDFKWTPAMHAPKESSRIHLEVTRVRVERACDIREDDARAEGFDSKRAFLLLWQSIYGHFAEDKWCWCINFRRVK